MERATRRNLGNLFTEDREAQNQAFFETLAETERPVSWAYEVWDDLVKALLHPDNHVRAIAAQVLCSLSKSDPENRMLRDFDALFAVTKDERFVTARHCLQSIWKVGAAGEQQRYILVQALHRRFQECGVEKNCTLIRYDISEGMRKLYDDTGDEAIREQALAWIATEEDLKYRKKYIGLWKAGRKQPDRTI